MRFGDLPGVLVEGSSDGPTLVLLHGIGLGPWIWERDQRRWAEQHGLSSLALELPGHGSQSDQDPGLGQLAESVSRSLSSLKGPVALIGHSMGGLVAQMVASQVDVQSLVCVASATPKAVWMRPTRTGIRSFLPQLMGLARGRPLALSEKAYLDCGFDQLPSDAQSKALQRLTPWPNRLTRELGLSRPDIPRDAISAPMLVVHGFKDPIVTLHQSRLLADYFGAVLWRFDDVSHHPMLEPAGVRVADNIAEFVTRPRRRLVREIDAFSPEEGIGQQAREARDPNPVRSDSRFGDRRKKS